MVISILSVSKSIPGWFALIKMVIIVNEIKTQNISEELPVPLFHQPLIIDGKRLRKPVSRFEPSPVPQAEQKVDITGNGTTLENLEKVKQEIEKLDVAEIKKFHKLLFGHVGRQSLQKLTKKIGEFNGFPFAGDSQEYKKRKMALSKMSVDDITIISKILGLSVESTDQMIINIMEFLMEPKQLAGSQKRKSDSDDNPIPKKKASDSERQSEARHRLSESSDSDGEMHSLEASIEKNVPQAAKPKKQVTFEDMVRQDGQLDDSNRNGAYVSSNPEISNNRKAES